jgi:hypothetical protein
MDREMSRFVRKIVEAWPFEDVAGTVATACDQLRQEGESPRLWAAPVVY